MVYECFRLFGLQRMILEKISYKVSIEWDNYGIDRIKLEKSVHRTRMPPPNAIQKKGLYVTVTGIP